MKTSICLVSKVSRGRNVNFYYLPECCDEPNSLQEQIIRCYATEKIIVRVYKSCYFGACGVTVFRSLGDPVRNDCLLTDFETSPITGERIGFWNEKYVTDYKFWLEYEGNMSRAKYNKYFHASIDLRGIFSAKKMNLPEMEIIDLSALREAQSYRLVGELNTETITRDNRCRID